MLTKHVVTDKDKKESDSPFDGHYACVRNATASEPQFGARPADTYSENSLSEVQVWRLLDWWHAAAQSPAGPNPNIERNVRDCAMRLWKYSFLHAAMRPKNAKSAKEWLQTSRAFILRGQKGEVTPRIREIDDMLKGPAAGWKPSVNEWKGVTDRTSQLRNTPAHLAPKLTPQFSIVASNPFLEDLFVWVTNELLRIPQPVNKTLRVLLKDLCSFLKSPLFSFSPRNACLERGLVIFPAIVKRMRDLVATPTIVDRMCAFPHLIMPIHRASNTQLACWLALFMEWEPTDACKAANISLNK